MENTEKLRNVRNLMLKQHKTLLDREREFYEGIHGRLTASTFLNVILEDGDFSWLRKFSMLIVEIDELFAAKDGYDPTMIDANLVASKELIETAGGDDKFNAKYEFALLHNEEAASLHGEIVDALR